MHDRELDRQVAELLGDKEIAVPREDSEFKTAWQDTRGGIHYTTDGGPPFYSAGGEYGTAPLILAEVARRGKHSAYVYALDRTFDRYGEIRPGDTEYTWALLTATPEQHCRAFLIACQGGIRLRAAPGGQEGRTDGPNT